MREQKVKAWLYSKTAQFYFYKMYENHCLQIRTNLRQDL